MIAQGGFSVYPLTCASLPISTVKIYKFINPLNAIDQISAFHRRFLTANDVPHPL